MTISAETRAKMVRAALARWQDPAYRAHHLARLSDLRGGGRPKGYKLSAETREKIRLALKAKWSDPTYRAQNLPQLLAAQKKGRDSFSARTRVVPPKGTPERRVYLKVRSILGPDVARSLQW